MTTSEPDDSRTFGVRRDDPDARDHYYEPSPRTKYPRHVDLRAHMPPVFDQETLNSCSANAIAAAIWFYDRKQSPDSTSPSRLFIYFNERDKEGLIDKNAPVSLRDGYQSVIKTGVCREPQWPYDVRLYKHRPPDHCYKDAEKHRVIRYLRVRRELTHFRELLASGHPFTVALSVYESFKSREVRKSGVVPMPAAHEKELGGHAMVVSGYDDDNKEFIVRNSWGPLWGDHGYCRMPYAYFENPDLAWDFWAVQRSD